MRGRIGAAICLMLAGCGADKGGVDSAGTVPAATTGEDHEPPDANWRRVATPADRGRLRGWRGAWVDALAQVDPSDVARERALFDPDHALVDPLPRAGTYRCRTYKLGARTGKGPAFIGYGWFSCRIDHSASGDTLEFTKRDGSQRPVGTIFPETDARGIFLGTMQLGDETRPMPYGRDANRDMAGVIERIGPQRWRLVLPYPRFESVLDVIELVPAG